MAFLLFSLTYSRQISAKLLSSSWTFLIVTAVVFPVSVFLYPLRDFFYSPDIWTERILFLGQTGYWFYMGIMTYCVIALVNIEATFLASSSTDRWKMKFEVVGISAILAVLVFYFSQGLLYRTINMNLMPVRSGVLIIAALLVGYSRLFRGNDARVAVSRYILYRSLTLLMVGLYLLILGLVGEGMRYLGISFSRDLTIFIAFATGMAMMLIFVSEQLRRKAKVYINKHFYAHKHDYRNEWLKFTRRLSSCKTIADVQNVILATYKETFGLEGASLHLFDKDKEKYGLAASQAIPDCSVELKASSGLISYFRRQGRIFNPLDSEYAPTAEEASFVRQTGTGLIVPLIGNGSVEGIVVFGKQLVKEDYIYEDYDLMKAIAKQAALSVVNFSLSEELAETREIAAVARISSFVIHDLKNLVSALCVSLNNAEDYIGEPEFQKDMLETVGNTTRKMKELIQRLKTIPEKQALNTELADLSVLAEEAVREVKKARTGTRFLYRGASISSMADVEEVRNVVLNLLLNAHDATNGNGTVRVETGCHDDMAYISVADNGCGIKEGFINNHLFKPFRTTKKKGLGIGLYQCKQTAEAHGGRIEVSSEVGKGSVFTVYLPAVSAMAQV
jgi:putative PEP-CTERM system histidine kinase